MMNLKKQYKKEKKVKLGITSTGHGLSNLITCVFFRNYFFNYIIKRKIDHHIIEFNLKKKAPC
jgi:hypothetical protein